ncbi:hypothetical protein SAPIO_CDS7805 [Scedosporium apiospermum]|uniref:Uncharacterized protein n=1 Tax=Pseudallescheria apiosperma TaxID=563466 RepID=A0A084G0Q2_PSEDA|nr:uncharacterized protein SAPIO_CDS7805 [Scedosporium apiospermum]KEZ40914.1 hypothetical protein SAPIO_CDS7805 [Scedosporium apiospermum]
MGEPHLCGIATKASRAPPMATPQLEGAYAAISRAAPSDANSRSDSDDLILCEGAGTALPLTIIVEDFFPLINVMDRNNSTGPVDPDKVDAEKRVTVNQSEDQGNFRSSKFTGTTLTHLNFSG